MKSNRREFHTVLFLRGKILHYFTLEVFRAAENSEKKEKHASDNRHVSQDPNRFLLLSRICAAFVACIGLVALMGWILGLPFLASLGPGMIPVAPSTAVLFMLYATAIFLRAHCPSHRGPGCAMSTAAARRASSRVSTAASQ